MSLRNPLTLFGLVLALLGAAAVGYVLTSALGPKDGEGLDRAVSGAMEKFEVTESRPLVPAAAFADAEGRAVSLNDFRGRVVLLNLWATWCAPCVEELPSLDRLEAALGGPDFVVVAVSLDKGGMATAGPFLEKIGIRSIAPYVDTDQSLGRAVEAPGIPVSVLLDREGREVGRVTGKAAWDSEAAKRLIRRVIEGGEGRLP